MQVSRSPGAPSSVAKLAASTTSHPEVSHLPSLMLISLMQSLPNTQYLHPPHYWDALHLPPLSLSEACTSATAPVTARTPDAGRSSTAALHHEAQNRQNAALFAVEDAQVSRYRTLTAQQLTPVAWAPESSQSALDVSLIMPTSLSTRISSERHPSSSKLPSVDLGVSHKNASSNYLSPMQRHLKSTPIGCTPVSSVLHPQELAAPSGSAQVSCADICLGIISKTRTSGTRLSMV